MRLRRALPGGLLVLLVASCGRDEQRPPQVAPPPTPLTEKTREAAHVPHYLVADPSPRANTFRPVALEAGVGLVVDGMRIVTSGGVLQRTAKEVTDPPLVAGWKLPARLGGGFLFRSSAALYTSGAFDGPLKPLASLTADIAELSIGPKGILVRGSNGERWAIDVGTGTRVPPSPPGVWDIAAHESGRAAALTEGGGVLVSGDGGATWSDVSGQVTSAEALHSTDDGVWIEQSSGPAYRVEAGGKLAAFQRVPTTKGPPPLRAKDPRWRNDEAPLRRAMRLGLPLDDGTALVVADGDVVRVTLATGELASVTQGRLPPDSTCDVVRSGDTLLFTCSRPNGVAFFATASTQERLPVIEQTFSAAGTFYVGDDGGIAFGGPCTRAKASRSIVCVRAGAGSWQEYDLEAQVGEGGAPLVIGRWLPRADGGVYGVVQGGTGLVDARTGELRPWSTEALPPVVRAALSGNAPRSPVSTGDRTDRTWSITPAGSLRGWAQGGAFELALDGSVTPSPFSFEATVTYGTYAMARMRDGRLWQTTDRGVSWVEVAGPLPLEAASMPMRSCSAVGCDLGSWYRVGWTPQAPSPIAAPTVAAPAPQLARAPVPQLVCKPTAEVKKSWLARTERNPEDLGLGVNRVAVNDDKLETEYLRTPLGRVMTAPVREATHDVDREESMPRAIVHGLSTTTGADDKLVLTGPAKDVNQLRRSVWFTAPFDPQGTVRKGTVAVSDIVTSARAAGIGDVLRQDPTLVTTLVPLTPSDVASASDLFFMTESGVVGALRVGAGKSRITLLSRRGEDTRPVGAVALGADDFAYLEVDSNGKSHVTKVTGTGAVTAFEIPGPPSSSSYPQNLDALAVGPKGELGLLRTVSGNEPAATENPALILAPGGLTGASPSASSPSVAITPLASWSTLTLADDAACKADAGGWRATLQTTVPWVRLAGPDLKPQEDMPMVARVRWSAARVCLEGIELRSEDASFAGGGAVVAAAPPPGMHGLRMRFGGSSSNVPWENPVENWVVARFGPGGGASRLAVIAGGELRQPLQCTLVR